MATNARTFDYRLVDGRHSAGNRVRTDVNPARAQIPEISRRVDRLRGVSRHGARQSQAGSNERENTPLPQEAATNQCESLTVLVADEHPVVREGLVALINRQPDMRVVGEASNGRDAVERFIAQRPDVAFLALRLPIVDGVEAVQAIREKVPAARLVIFTTCQNEEAIYRAVQAGAGGIDPTRNGSPSPGGQGQKQQGDWGGVKHQRGHCQGAHDAHPGKAGGYRAYGGHWSCGESRPGGSGSSRCRMNSDPALAPPAEEVRSAYDKHRTGILRRGCMQLHRCTWSRFKETYGGTDHEGKWCRQCQRQQSSGSWLSTTGYRSLLHSCLRNPLAEGGNSGCPQRTSSSALLSKCDDSLC